MKIGFLFFHPLTESLGSVRRVLDIATCLKEKGAEPIVITPFSRSTEINGIKIEGIPSIFLNFGLEEHVYRVARRLTRSRFFNKIIIRRMRRRMLDETLLNSLKKLKLDILQIEQEPAAVVAPLLQRELSAPLILDFHGIWAEELADSGIITRRDVEYQMLQETVRDAITCMDAVLVMSEEMKQYVLREYHVQPEKAHIVKLGAKPRIRELPDRGDPLKAIYAGILSKEKHSDLFLESVPHIVKRMGGVRFYVTEKGDMLNEAYKIRKELGVDMKSFWFHNEEDLFEFMSNCHAGILTLPDNLSYRINPAAKFFDYMSVGLPVVANDIGGWTKIIEKRKVGMLTRNTADDFAKGLLYLLENRDLALEYGRNSLELIRREYNLDSIVEDLLDVYRKLLQ